jgi:hypothetical protein
MIHHHPIINTINAPVCFSSRGKLVEGEIPVYSQPPKFLVNSCTKRAEEPMLQNYIQHKIMEDVWEMEKKKTITSYQQDI